MEKVEGFFLQKDHACVGGDVARSGEATDASINLVRAKRGDF
jgi:hypothetical protein